MQISFLSVTQCIYYKINPSHFLKSTFFTQLCILIHHYNTVGGIFKQKKQMRPFYVSIYINNVAMRPAFYKFCPYFQICDILFPVLSQESHLIPFITLSARSLLHWTWSVQSTLQIICHSSFTLVTETSACDRSATVFTQHTI